MLNKLQSRFILITMLLVGVIIASVMLYVFANAVVTNWNTIDRSLEEAIEMEKQYGQDADNEEFLENYNRMNENVFRDVYVVNMKKTDGTYSFFPSELNIYSMNTEDLKQLADGITASGKEQGWIFDEHIIFKTVPVRDAVCVGVAYSFFFEETVKAVLVNSVSISVIVFVTFFFISNFLASLAFKPAEKAWEQQQHFLADASHELKTPLTVILANNNILLAHPQETVADEMKWVQSTQTEAEHMRNLVDQLLFLSRADNTKCEIPKESIDLSELAWSNLLQFEPVAFEKGVGFDGNIENGLSVQGDKTQLNQLIHILLDNAIKYAGSEGKVDWELSKQTGKTKGQTAAVLKVHNTGTPIPPDDIPHIFERFYRSDRARSAGSGYGLGLAIAKQICDSHQAEISVESNMEKGTTFAVRFRPETVSAEQ